MAKLPDYVVIQDEKFPQSSVLRRTARDLSFPLTPDDLQSISELIQVFESETPQGAGLAAPQIGISKRLIVFHVLEEYKSFRKNVTDLYPQTVWVNPQYQGVGSEKDLDWEACFSVRDQMAEIPRFKKIQYQAYTVSGIRVEGTATGFFARLLQHEIGHLNGELFIDLVTEGCRSGSIAEMRALREQERREAKTSQ